MRSLTVLTLKNGKFDVMSHLNNRPIFTSNRLVFNRPISVAPESASEADLSDQLSQIRLAIKQIRLTDGVYDSRITLG